MVDNITTTTRTTPLSNLKHNDRQYNNTNMNLPSVKPETVMVANITTATSTTPLSNLKQ
jgi:hypothetical protein